MPKQIRMPKLSDTMEEGRLIAWRKRVGDAVKRGEVIAEIETDKADMEFEAYTEGVVAQIVVEAGATVPVGTLIAVLRLPGESEDAVAAAGAQHEPRRHRPPRLAKPAPRRRRPAAPAAPKAAPRAPRAAAPAPARIVAMPSPGRGTARAGAARRGRRPSARHAARAPHGGGEVDRSLRAHGQRARRRDRRRGSRVVPRRAPGAGARDRRHARDAARAAHGERGRAPISSP